MGRFALDVFCTVYILFENTQAPHCEEEKVCWTDKVSSPNCVCYFESILIVAVTIPLHPIHVLYRRWTENQFHSLSMTRIL